MTTNDTTDREETTKHLLLVEDEPAAREASQMYLTLRGYHVDTAASVDAAIRQAEQKEPDLLVCDWRLGAGGNGVDAARELRARYQTPVIFVSAHPMDELREQTSDMEVADYLIKPVSLPELEKAIARAIS